MTIFDQPVPLSRMRRAVVRTVTASAAIPQYTLTSATNLQELNAALTEARHTSESASISDVIHAAVIGALIRHPNVNASFSDEGIVQHSKINLAFIIETDDGMVAPAIMDAGAKPIDYLTQERKRLTAAATSGNLRPGDVLNGTFTVSNLGRLGVLRFNAMVLPPQAAILAVGSPEPSGAVSVTLTCDHRVVDGAPAARFLSEVTRQITGGGR